MDWNSFSYLSFMQMSFMSSCSIRKYTRGETKPCRIVWDVQRLWEWSVKILMWDTYSTTFDQTFDHCAPRAVVIVRIWQRIKFDEFLVLGKRWKQAAARLMSLGRHGEKGQVLGAGLSGLYCHLFPDGLGACWVMFLVLLSIGVQLSPWAMIHHDCINHKNRRHCRQPTQRLVELTNYRHL